MKFPVISSSILFANYIFGISGLRYFPNTVARFRLLQLRGGFKDSSIKLTYFDAKGAAEVTRILLKIGGIAFEDLRYSIKVVDGKFETPEFNEAKNNGDLSANMNRAPILEVDGVVIGQSKAMERYVAKQCDMFGSNDEEAAVIDCVSEHVRDIKEKWGKIRMMGGMGAPTTPEKEAATKKWFESELGEWLVKLEKSLPITVSAQFTIGTKLSYSDVCIWHLIKETFDATQIDFVKNALDGCPRLNAITENVAGNENIKLWLVSRPTSMF